MEPHEFSPSKPVNPTDRFFLRTLGGFELCAVNADGTPGERVLGPGKPLALLAYCVCTPHKRHSRDRIAQLLWGDAPVDRLRQNVRQALWRLRRTLGDAITTGDDAIVALSANVTCDHQLFTHAMQRGDVPAALAAYDGAFLSGISMSGGDEFEDWVAVEGQRLTQMLIQQVAPALTDLTRSGRHSAARALLERLDLVAGDVAGIQQISAATYLTLGDRMAARRAAEKLELRVMDLDAGEAATATALIARARRDAPDAGTTDHGAVMAMDLTGREEAFADIIRAWKRAKQGETQAVILTGIAGVGKSRLLSAVATRCSTGNTRALLIRANPGERDIPYSLAAQMARTLVAQPGAMGIDPASARELVALDPGLATTFRVGAATHDDGEATRRRAAALYDLLAAVSEQQPMVLLFDDLHWCDPASRQVLSSVVARALDLPLLVVAAARGIATDFLSHPRELRLPLLPLDLATTIDAIRSCGTWPDDPGAARFVQRLAESAGGIPQHVIERLSLAVEKGWLSGHDGTWASPDWLQACSDVMITSPLDHRLQGCSMREREVLLALSLAGTSLPVRIVHSAVAQASMAQVVRALSVMETKGLVISNGDSWQPSHDLILERMIALSTAAEQEATHAGLAEAMLAAGQSTSAIAATRHFLSARLEARAALVFAQIVARCRRSGDPRHVCDLAADIVGARLGSRDVDVLVRAVPWWQRSARTVHYLSAGVATLLLLLGAGVAWSATRLPPLLMSQSVVLADATPVYGPNSYRFTPPLLVRGRAARAGDAESTRVVRLRIPTGTARVLTGGEARMDSSGVAIFGALRLYATDSVVPLRFEAPGHGAVIADLPISEQTSDRGMSVHLLEGNIASQVVRGRDARISVARGAPIRGVIQVQYSSDYRSASVWLAMTPSWGDPKTAGRDVTPVTTPMKHNVIDVSIDYVAPDRPGRYWLLLVLAADDSGGFILSRSNWTMGTPLWGDGNDVASLPDSLIREANQNGRIMSPLARSRSWQKKTFGNARVDYDTNCRILPQGREVPDVFYCAEWMTMFGIEVVVK
jgi:DNA-binding SARP family transcriptional activator